MTDRTSEDNDDTDQFLRFTHKAGACVIIRMTPGKNLRAWTVPADRTQEEIEMSPRAALAAIIANWPDIVVTATH